MNGRAWTVQSEDELKKLLKDGLTYQDIGLLLDRTMISVQKKVSKLGLTGDRVHALKSPETRMRISRAKIGHMPWNKGKIGGTSWNKGKKHPSIVGRKNPNWNGGIKARADGYRYIYKPDHPCANGCYVMEHRLVMEDLLGRYLDPEEIVHHINGDRRDNSPDNLQLFKNTGEHTAYHAKIRRMGNAQQMYHDWKTWQQSRVKVYATGQGCL